MLLPFQVGDYVPELLCAVVIHIADMLLYVGKFFIPSIILIRKGFIKNIGIFFGNRKMFDCQYEGISVLISVAPTLSICF